MRKILTLLMILIMSVACGQGQYKTVTVPSTANLSLSGGATDQVLKKNSATDYDFAWATVSGVGTTFTASLGSVFSSVAKTNIGVNYVDIYASAFDQENFLKIDFTGVTSVRIVYIWDYVGAGNQQIRWADAGDNANVLFETATFAADQDPGDTGWFALPQAFQGTTKQIEWQGKSTTSTDDPVAKGYIIFVK